MLTKIKEPLKNKISFSKKGGNGFDPAALSKLREVSKNTIMDYRVKNDDRNAAL
jgi:hypothetical protein